MRRAGTNSLRGHLGAFPGFSSCRREKCPCPSGINWYRPLAAQVLRCWGGGKGLAALLWIQSSQPRSGFFFPHPVGLLLLLPVCTLPPSLLLALPPSFTLFLSPNATLQKGRPGNWRSAEEEGALPCCFFESGTGRQRCDEGVSRSPPGLRKNTLKKKKNPDPTNEEKGRREGGGGCWGEPTPVGEQLL